MDEKEHGRPEGDTRVLSDEERRNFQGVTINEGNGSEDEGERSDCDERTPFVKVYTLQSLSLWQKIALAIVTVAALALIFFVGGIFLMGFFIVVAVGAVLSLLRKLF